MSKVAHAREVAKSAEDSARVGRPRGDEGLVARTPDLADDFPLLLRAKVHTLRRVGVEPQPSPQWFSNASSDCSLKTVASHTVKERPYGRGAVAGG